MVGRKAHLADGLGQRLALVEHHAAADLLGLAAGEIGEAAENPAAVERRGFLPVLEGALGGGDGGGEIGVGRMRQMADDRAGGGIGHRVLPLGPVDPAAVDEHAEPFVTRGGGSGHGGLRHQAA